MKQSRFIMIVIIVCIFHLCSGCAQLLEESKRDARTDTYRKNQEIMLEHLMHHKI